MNPLPYRVGGLYLRSSVSKAENNIDFSQKGFISVKTVHDGVTYIVEFERVGESPLGQLVKCTLCQPIHD